jgi:hypothetical protein
MEVGSGLGQSDQVLEGVPLENNLSQLEENTTVEVESSTEPHLPIVERQLFDLNVSVDQAATQQGPLPTAENILGEADGRLNRELRDHHTQRPVARGMAKFAAPLKKALLCNPPPRSKTASCKKGPIEGGPFNQDLQASQADKKRCRIAGRQLPHLSLEEQVSCMLLKATGATGQQGLQPAQVAIQLGEALCLPMQDQTVANVRETLGLTVAGEADKLAALISEAGDGGFA